MARWAAALAVLMAAATVGWGAAAQDAPREAMAIGVVGLTHSHVHWAFGAQERGDVRIAAIVEPDRTLARRYIDQYGLSMDIVYDDLETMLDEVRPVGVTAFGATDEHLAVVRAAAPRGIHVMVEKPLAISLDHARQMAALAREHGVHVLTNYETSWYATTHRTREMVRNGAVGPVRKMVFHHGHQGPVEIGVPPEFLAWLTDPARNGGGAITDFGCYGANLATWLMDGARPTSVLAVTQQLQPEHYPDVDDEATIVLTYPDAQAIIQASWNWPYSRKDMEIYGANGRLLAEDARHLSGGSGEDGPDWRMTLDPRPAPHDDPFALFRAVIEGEVELPPDDLYALENNLVVMEILDAARESAATGRAVAL